MSEIQFQALNVIDRLKNQAYRDGNVFMPMCNLKRGIERAVYQHQILNASLYHVCMHSAALKINLWILSAATVSYKGNMRSLVVVHEKRQVARKTGAPWRAGHVPLISVGQKISQHSSANSSYCYGVTNNVASGFRHQASGMGLFYIRVNVKAFK